MKRYLVFAGDQHYPSGGWDDFKGSFDDEKSAHDWIDDVTTYYDWWQIIDFTTGHCVDQKN